MSLRGSGFLARVRLCVWLATGLLVGTAGRTTSLAQIPAAPSAPAGQTGSHPGEAVARRYCQACHLFPTPDLLDQKTWATGTLRRMAPLLGVARLNLDQRPDGAILKEAHLFPGAPILSQSDWQAIFQYYVQSAPATALPQGARSPIRRGQSRFEVEVVRDAAVNPAITFVRVDASNHTVELGDARRPGLHVLDARLVRTRTFEFPSAPVSASFDNGFRWMAAIGDVFPSDAKSGQVIRLPADLGGAKEGQGVEPVLSGLKRPVDCAVGDLNADGRPDLVIAQFGNYLGRLAWFERTEDGRLREHVLLEAPGALKVLIRDLTGDGRPDVLALMAQAREGFFLFENRGGGEFAMRTLLEFPSVHGSTGFEMVDMDGDGADDLLVTNGDNGEYASPFKRYHGIRVYRNEGGTRFRERWFYPLNGAFKAVARDFDGDGDRDIVAISFFPDYERSPEEGVVYLENRGDFRFEASTLEDPNPARWLTLDAGDLDGDGDIDVVLGAFNDGPRGTPIPATLEERWRTNAIPALLLRNTSRGLKAQEIAR